MDLNLPGINGFEFLAKCLDKNLIVSADIVVMLLNSPLIAEQVEEANQLGMKHFLDKPLDASELAKIVLP